MTSKPDGTTHADGCYRWGPRHYDCALREIERQKREHDEDVDRMEQAAEAIEKLNAECNDLQHELATIYDAFQIGKGVRALHILLENISNARRRSECLSGIEALFTTPADPDDEESVDECPLNWGAEPDEYVRQFEAAFTGRVERELAEARADLERSIDNHSADLSAERASVVPTATNRPGHISSTTWRAPLRSPADQPEGAMKTLIFGGYSDDTFGEITPRGDDYGNCANGKPVEYLIESVSEQQSIIIVGQYCPGAATGWLIGVARHDEDDGKPLPSWPVRLRPGECTYSPALEIDVPDDATLRCLTRDRHD